MPYPTTQVLANILCCLVGVWIGHRLAIGREDRARRIHFIGELSGHKILLAKTGDDDFPIRTANMQVAVEKECARVRSAIPRLCRKRFAAARKELASKKDGDIMDWDNATSRFSKALMTYSVGRMVLDGLLSELIACAK